MFRAGSSRIRNVSLVDRTSHDDFHNSFRLTRSCNLLVGNRQVCQVSKRQTASSVDPSHQHPSKTATQDPSGVCRAPSDPKEFGLFAITGNDASGPAQSCP